MPMYGGEQYEGSKFVVDGGGEWAVGCDGKKEEVIGQIISEHDLNDDYYEPLILSNSSKPPGPIEPPRVKQAQSTFDIQTEDN